jgi:hemolysin III
MKADGVYPFIFRDPLSAGLHLIWCLWSVYTAGLLWRLSRGDRWRQWSVGCFGASMIVLYGVSGIYHAIPQEATRLVHYFQRIDHSAIYLLIAGTYTPIFAVLLHGQLRAALLALLWGMTLTGIVCKWVLPWPPFTLTVGLYLAVGWVGVIPAYHLTRAVGLRAMALGVLGGLLYTTGGVCEALRWPILVPGVLGHHEILHLCDMAATLTHVAFVTRYVIPFVR